MKRIDMDSWSRRDQYLYFSGMGCPYCSLTCDIDITAALSFMKSSGIPSHLGMVYLIAKAANGVPELRTRIEPEGVCEYDVVHPSFTLLNEQDQLRFCRARYVAAPGDFIARTRELVDRIKSEQEGPLEAPSQDVLYLTCLPWVHFTAISHPMNIDSTDAIPRIAWGRYEPRGEGTVMALNLQVHHGLADGLHIARFMRAMSSLCAAPEDAFAG